ncbi:MAG: amino acid ABC transporter permease [Oscillospiraceae bacterium]|nr:amino acid ABC transporter permease [Oscillospiraceae bacterium]
MFWTVTLSLFRGMGEALEIFCLTLLFSLPLGLVIAFGSMSRFKPLAKLVNLIIWVIRGTPLMLQLLIIFYGPGLWMENNIWAFSSGRMVACIVAFVINYACYFSVIYRGGIEGVSRGQREAGQVLGMTKSQIFFKVTLLQMVKRIVPPMSNEIITLVKDTSLSRVIAITEIIKAGENFIKSDGIIWPLFYTAVYYLLMVGLLTILFNAIERKLSYFR